MAGQTWILVTYQAQVWQFKQHKLGNLNMNMAIYDNKQHLLICTHDLQCSCWENEQWKTFFNEIVLKGCMSAHTKSKFGQLMCSPDATSQYQTAWVALILITDKYTISARDTISKINTISKMDTIS